MTARRFHPLAACALALLLPTFQATSLPAQALGFGPPAALNTNAATDAGNDTNAQLATDGLGNWVAVWVSLDDLGGTIGTDQDILVSRSANNGLTWSAPAALNSNAATDSALDFDLEPEVSSDGAGNWIAVWRSNNDLGGTIGTNFDIFVSRSSDDGQTWSPLGVLNSNAATSVGLNLAPQATSDGAGNWVAIWRSSDDIGGTGTDSDILVSRSTDNGQTWTALAPLNSNATTDAGLDQSPQLTTDGAGNWVAVWASSDSLGGTIGTDADIFVARSIDNGLSWTAPAALNSNAATDSSVDFPPSVATDGAGNWVAVWESNDDFGGTIGLDFDVLVARSIDNGATWTPAAALNGNAAIDSGDDSQQEVTTDGAGNWVVVWRSEDSLGGTIGTDADILASHSTDNGATWTAPAALNSNATTDLGVEFQPSAATDGAGNWVVVWHSDENLGGTIGADQDILFSTSNTVPVEMSAFELE